MRHLPRLNWMRFYRGIPPMFLATLILLAASFHAVSAPNPILKLDSQLRLAAGLGDSTLAQPQSAASGEVVAGAPIMRNGKVLVQARLHVEHAQVRNQLQAAGLEIVSGFQGLVSGWIAPERLAELAMVQTVSTVHTVIPPITRSAPIQGEGVSALWADYVHHEMGYDGSGVKVGILSDSFAVISNATPYFEIIDGATYVLGTDSQLAGEIPERIQILADLEVGEGIDEGRAMAEIIHEMAPGADLAFHTAFLSESMFAEGIVSLAQAGCSIIVDDVGYLLSPIFQEGELDQAIRIAADEYDAVYFTAAGNDGNYVIEAFYHDINPHVDDGPHAKIPSGNNFHDWTGGTIGYPNEFLRITFHPGSTAYIILKWENPYSGLLGAGAYTDYDMFLLRSRQWSLNNIVAASDSYQGTRDTPFGDPFEFIVVTNTSTVEIIDAYLAINRHHGEPVPFRLFIYPSGPISLPDTPRRGDTSAIFSHPTSEAAMAVGAVNVRELLAHGLGQSNPRQISPAWYTSKGGWVYTYFSPNGERLETPTRVWKPDIASVDDAVNSFFGYPVDYDGQEAYRFPGTSAAAPHAAAIAALMREANPHLSAVEIRRLMRQSAVDIHEPGIDPYTGWGLVYADYAVEAALNPPPPEAGELPRNSVIVTNSLSSWADLSNRTAFASPSYRALVIRWNIQEANVVDYHLYVTVNGGSPQFLGRTGSANAAHFEWSTGVERFIDPVFVDGPQFGETYRFYLYAIRQGQTPLGPYLNPGPVLFVQGN